MKRKRETVVGLTDRVDRLGQTLVKVLGAVSGIGRRVSYLESKEVETTDRPVIREFDSVCVILEGRMGQTVIQDTRVDALINFHDMNGTRYNNSSRQFRILIRTAEDGRVQRVDVI